MDKKVDDLKTCLVERLTTQETNLKELCNNLVKNRTNELPSELKIQAKKN